MMSSFRTTTLMIILLLAQTISACMPQSSAAETSLPPTAESPGDPFARVTIPGSEVRQLESSATGRSYDIYVRLPDEYAPDQGKKYPVLYLLDGQWDFKLLDSIYGGLYYDS